VTLREPARVDVELPVEPVAGKLTLGGRPLQARLVLREPVSGARLELDTDARGALEGHLPLALHSPARPWEIGVRASEPLVRTTLREVRIDPGSGGDPARLELDLPDTALAGEIRVALLRDVPRVSLDLRESDVSRWRGRRVGCDAFFGRAAGRATTIALDVPRSERIPFSLHRLAPGCYSLRAEAAGAASARQWVEVDDGPARPVTLVLQPRVRVTLRVAAPRGLSALASVNVTPLGPVHRGHSLEEFADEDGRIELDLPADAREIGIWARAPGRASRLMRVPVSDGGTVLVKLTEQSARLRLRWSAVNRPEASPGRAFLFAGAFALPVQALSGRPPAFVASGARWEAVLETIEPGRYAACLLGADADVPPPEPPRGGRCASRLAQVARELVLDLPDR
jgi:hypothetical protein